MFHMLRTTSVIQVCESTVFSASTSKLRYNGTGSCSASSKSKYVQALGPLLFAYYHCNQAKYTLCNRKRSNFEQEI